MILIKTFLININIDMKKFKFEIGELVGLKLKNGNGLILHRKFEPFPFGTIDYFTYDVYINGQIYNLKENEMTKVNQSPIILMDMDGTITPARKAITPSMEKFLYSLLLQNWEIGIVSGSTLDYINEQTKGFQFASGASLFNQIHVLPCNGTQYYRNNKEVYKLDMINEISPMQYSEIVQYCFEQQIELMQSYTFDVTGHVVDYRGSMLNWCPIGRLSKGDKRQKWESIDLDNQIRLPFLQRFRNKIKKAGWDIEIKLGGETSFDIYPIGWDKTYSFKNFQNRKVYFIGDRCTPTGNDYEAFVKAGERGYNTKGPDNTIEIIKNIINMENTNG